MKLRLLLFSLGLTLSGIISAFGQSPATDEYWEGTLNIGGSLRLGFHLPANGNTTMDSPDQGAMNIPAVLEKYNGDSLVIAVSSISGYYRGKIQAADSSIQGQWVQRGMPFPLVLRKRSQATGLLRPQNPKEPFPYGVTEVTFPSMHGGHSLAGTLTLPPGSGPFPAVILISGSGPQDRDETLMGHKPFWVIADYLTRKGIAVLRFDDRGIGKSGGQFEGASAYDFAEDVKGAIAFLRNQGNILPGKIGLIGHSEGGMVAQMICAKDRKLAFMVSMAGPGVPCKDLLIRQSQDIYRASGYTDEASLRRYGEYLSGLYEIIIRNGSSEKTLYLLQMYIQGWLPRFSTSEQRLFQINADVTSPAMKELTGNWFVRFIRFDPGDYIPRIQCPVLAINGAKDVQVAAGPNLKGYTDQVKDKAKLTTREYSELNHLFQHCSSGLPAEYGKITETISEEVLKDMGEWIVAHSR